MATDKIKKVQAKLDEARADLTKMTEELEDFNSALESTIRDYAIDEATQKDIDKGQSIIDGLKQDISKKNEFIQSLEEAKAGIVDEELPKVKGLRKRSVNNIQKQINEQEDAVRHARNVFINELAKIGQLKKKAGSANAEYRNALTDAGVKVDFHDSIEVKSSKLNSPGGYTHESKTLGISLDRQGEVLRNGNVPNWAKIDNDKGDENNGK